MQHLVSLSNEELLGQLQLLCAKERNATADVIVYLAEVERRRLYLDAACSSPYSFCVERLGYSENAALKRVRVARLYQKLPQILQELRDGTVHLTGLFLLSNRMTAGNADALLTEARGKTRREIERMLACRFPKSDVLPSVTPLGPSAAARSTTLAPATGPGDHSTCLGPGESGCATGQSRTCLETWALVSAPADDAGDHGTCLGPGEIERGTGQGRTWSGDPRTCTTAGKGIDPAGGASRARVEPLSTQSYRVEFTARAELVVKLEQAQALLSHAVAPGALANLFERALDALIALETKRRRGVARDERRQRVASDKRFQGVARDGQRQGVARGEQDQRVASDQEVASDQGVARDESRKRREPKAGSRHVPLHVARVVWERDGHQCTFVDAAGRRCSEKHFVTMEHCDPHTRGGPPTEENLCLLCGPHNQHAARRVFGEEFMQRKQREAQNYAKASSALVHLGFSRKPVKAALDSLRKRGVEQDVRTLVRQAALLLCPSKQVAPQRTDAAEHLARAQPAANP